MMLKPESAVLVVVDVQEKLTRVMHQAETVVANVAALAAGAKILDVPVLLTEQNPAGLGSTVAPVAEAINAEPIDKRAFSCWAEPGFATALQDLGRSEVILAGIEAHVCIYQTARDLLRAGYGVHLICDAVTSRTAADAKTAIARMVEDGARRGCVEMALLEMQQTSQGPRFKQLLELIK
ncbi:MAG: isochorismatase family protein [Phycisphaerae bacterium]